MPSPKPTVQTKLYRRQFEFFSSTAIYRAFCGGRGAGKSFVGAVDLLARTSPDCTYLVGSPTGVMLNDTTLPTLKNVASAGGMLADIKYTPYPTIKLTNGAVVRFRTAEDPDKMRGPNLSGVWLDEASLMRQDAYDICIASLREGGRQGWLSATFTPQGPSHWTHEVFNTGRPDTALFRARTGDNPFLPDGFEETISKQFGDSQFARQELGGEFVQIEGVWFPAEWFDWDGFWFDEWPDKPMASVVYLDPSAGRGNNPKKGDFQAYVTARLYRHPDGQQIIYLDAEMNREPPTAMIARGFEIVRRLGGVNVLGYEENGTMGFMEPEISRQRQDRQVLLNWMPVWSTENKLERMRVIGSYLSRRQIRIRNSPGGRILRAQLADIPFGIHDDGPDAAAGALQLLAALTMAPR